MHARPGGTAVRIAVVLFLASFALANAGLEFLRLAGHPIGEFGFATDGSVVTAVSPDSPAAKAGLRIGEAISLQHNNAAERDYALRGMARAPGDVLNVSVIAPRPRDVTLTAVAEARSNLPYWS